MGKKEMRKVNNIRNFTRLQKEINGRQFMSKKSNQTKKQKENQVMKNKA